MAEITWTREAEIWLKDIYEFIARDNPDIAAEVIEGIRKNADAKTASKSRPYFS